MLAVVQPGPGGAHSESPSAELAVRRFDHDRRTWSEGAPRPSPDEHAQEQDVLGLGERDRDYLLDWVGEHLTLVRQSASGQRPMYWVLGTVFVVGLAAHVGRFLLKTWVTTEPWLVVGDLIYTFG